MKPKKRKNIEPFLADIRHPSRQIRDERFKPADKFLQDGEKWTKDSTVPGPEESKPGKKMSRRDKIVIALVLIVCLFSFGYQMLNRFISSARDASEKFNQASTFFSVPAGNGDSTAGTDQNSIEMELPTVFSYFRLLPDFFGKVKTLNADISAGVGILGEIKSAGAGWLFEDGEKLLAKMAEAEKSIDKINADFVGVRTSFSSLGLEDSIPENYLQIQSNFRAASDFIRAAGDFIANGNHLLVLFENDSEIRPGGGFAGSYADVYFEKGEIKNIEVNDVLMPDGAWNSKIVPPKPLWPISSSWEARDANWFFDFPLSAEKLMTLTESSPVYRDAGVEFGGVVALNTKVITDILAITGPVDLPDSGLTLNAENFLAELQKQVSTDALTRGSSRKDILKELTPALIARIRALPSEANAELFSRMSERAKDKDVKVYFRDSKLEGLMANLQISGESFGLPENFFGDYLAVVNANINGGKTDAFVSQDIRLATTILSDGNIQSELQVTRRHSGDERTESYYRTTNQNFLRILVPLTTRETKVSGATAKQIAAPVNFSSYKRDPDVQLFESGEESGKAWFGHWFNLKAGQTKELDISYERPSALVSQPFRFIYEKQSGVETGLHYRLEAPAGYIFRETGSGLFTYDVDKAPSRVMVTLNLERQNL